VSGKPPEATHCNNIGPPHRAQIYPALEKWFDLPQPEKEYQQRRPGDELLCLTPELTKTLQPRSVHDLAASLAGERAAGVRERIGKLPEQDRRATWKREWERLLGKVVAEGKPEVAIEGTESVGDSTVERGVVRSEAGIEVPFVLLRPKGEKKAPVV